MRARRRNEAARGREVWCSIARVRASEGTTLDHMTLETLSAAVVSAGLEIYRVEASELRIAERVRMHLMDSGVAVAVDPALRVSLTVRAQRSDFPSASAGELFERVRGALEQAASARGYSEASAQARDIVNPADESDVLDVWHELTFTKSLADASSLIDEVRWALSIPKCVDP